MNEERRIHVSLTPDLRANEKKPYFWKIRKWKDNDWVNSGLCGWEETPEKAWEEAYRVSKLKDGMEIFYFTFGNGQTSKQEIEGRIVTVRMEGKCQPIQAKNQQIAHQKMHEMYGTAWSWCYTQEKWDSMPYYKEKELEIITVED